MKKRVLFIEDEAFTVKAFVKYLNEFEDYNVELLEDLTEAVRLLSIHKYDLIILDIMLPHNGIIDEKVSPKKSGIAFARALRQGRVAGHNVAENADIPLLVLTAVVDPRSTREIKMLKPAGILRKPVAWTEFFDAVQTTTSSHTTE